ncbi:MAG: M48 family metallopeptidase [Gammaproteobacteria bacterium]|nr:M48 family metallopeptidase [Gammaproteobacteria bacterium]
MRYVPRSPREGINVSDEHPLKEAAVLVVGLSFLFAIVMLSLVFIVDLVVVAVSPETEARIFSGWTPGGIVELVDDDSRQRAVAGVLQRIETGWPDSPYDFRLLVADDDEPNALAVPGGVIVVTTGLLDKVGSENELAFVLAHELGHFRNRDHLRGIGRGVALAIFYAAISGGSGGADIGIAVADLTLRQFSRDQEAAADRFGLELVQAEYGHVADSWRFFERLRDTEAQPGIMAAYLSTHPDTGDRIEDIRRYARDSGWSTVGRTTPLDW